VSLCLTEILVSPLAGFHPSATYFPTASAVGYVASSLPDY